MRKTKNSLMFLCVIASLASAVHAETVFQDNFNRPDAPALGGSWTKLNETNVSVFALNGQRIDPGYINLSAQSAVFHYVKPVGGTANAHPVAHAPLLRSSMNFSMSFSFIAGSDRMGHSGGLMTTSEGFFYRAPEVAPGISYDPMTGIEVMLSKSDALTPNSSLCVQKYWHGIASNLGCTTLPFQFALGRSYATTVAMSNDVVTASTSDGLQTVTSSYPLSGFVFLADRVFVRDVAGGVGQFGVPGSYTVGFDNVVVTAPDVRTIAIDIRPGDAQNTINLNSNGVIPVAMLSDSTFDATQVDPASVSLAGATVKLIGKGQKYSCYTHDVNSDGKTDLVCNVQTDLFTLEQGDSAATLEARTFSGMSIRGTDLIRIVP